MRRVPVASSSGMAALNVPLPSLNSVEPSSVSPGVNRTLATAVGAKPDISMVTVSPGDTSTGADDEMGRGFPDESTMEYRTVASPTDTTIPPLSSTTSVETGLPSTVAPTSPLSTSAISGAPSEPPIVVVVDVVESEVVVLLDVEEEELVTVACVA